MFRKVVFAVWVCFVCGACLAQQDTPVSLQVLRDVAVLIERGDFENAQQILSTVPPVDDLPLETERKFLTAQIATGKGDLTTAIKVYREILDSQPELSRVRFELAVCYMKNHQWYRADYHLRLAMAGADLPENVKRLMYYYRYVIRQNKNWNVWFNFGAAPDNNVNNTIGGEECVMTIFGPLCRQLPEPESAVGFNLTLGGNYEIKLSEHWRWKSEANIYSNTYNKHDYDDLYLSLGTGPRYVWKDGDVWLSATGSRRYYGWNGYNWSGGWRLDVNYDFTRRLSGGVQLRTVQNRYDDYGRYMDGYTYGTSGYLSYAINSRMSVVLRGGLEYEDTKDDVYTNLRPSVGIGVGNELPWGFYVYLEPSVYWSDYKGSRWVVKDEEFIKLKELSRTHRYMVSVSNSKFDVWGFVPTLTVSYTQRDSNIWQREFNKWSAEFTMRQKF